MWILLGAVLSASVVGSLHCVGMCGPLAIWASGAAERQRTPQMMLAVALYHFGRLLTYALAGLVAGSLGQLADWGGETLGVQLLAARVVGVAMVIIGTYKLFALIQAKRRLTAATTSGGSKRFQPLARMGSRITGNLVKLRPHVFRLSIPARGLVTGLLTALLPCGWLYLFALLAAGTGSALTGALVMSAFWLGSVPALIALVSGLQFLSGRFRQLIPVAAALLLIAAGITTASGRGFANLGSLTKLTDRAIETTASHGVKSNEQLAKSVNALVETPLPCCAAKNKPLEGASE